jgi:hypothetical protein
VVNVINLTAKCDLNVSEVPEMASAGWPQWRRRLDSTLFKVL